MRRSRAVGSAASGSPPCAEIIARQDQADSIYGTVKAKSDRLTIEREIATDFSTNATVRLSAQDVPADSTVLLKSSGLLGGMIAEVIPGFDFSSWYGLFGPAGMNAA